MKRTDIQEQIKTWTLMMITYFAKGSLVLAAPAVSLHEKIRSDSTPRARRWAGRIGRTNESKRQKPWKWAELIDLRIIWSSDKWVRNG